MNANQEIVARDVLAEARKLLDKHAGTYALGSFMEDDTGQAIVYFCEMYRCAALLADALSAELGKSR